MAKISEEELNEAIDLCKQILDEVDALPEAAEDFASSVSDKALSIQEWIEENDYVTPKQLSALKNMLTGIHRWMR